jgi:hypothetical protein
MSTEREILEAAYRAFNTRDIDAALATMHPDVAWPNGMEGGYVHGHRDVRDYWTRQWAIIDPHVEPLDFEVDADGRIVVNVHQVVRDLAGQVKADRVVQHVYELREELIVRMEIRTPTPA